MMGDIKEFRIGNYALFDGELQRIETQDGLDSSSFLDPIPITAEVFRQFGYSALEETSDYSIYLFKTTKKRGISVVFDSKGAFIIMEQKTRIEFPFIKCLHELQNLLQDKKQRSKGKKKVTERIQIAVQ
jgi:hypothetical protein